MKKSYKHKRQNNYKIIYKRLLAVVLVLGMLFSMPSVAFGENYSGGKEGATVENEVSGEGPGNDTSGTSAENESSESDPKLEDDPANSEGDLGGTAGEKEASGTEQKSDLTEDADQGDAGAEKAEEEQEQEQEELLAKAGTGNAPTNLRINLLTGPYGVSKDTLSFSWEDAAGMGDQAAYRIYVYKRNASMSQAVYDSGWQAGSDNSSLMPAGLSESLVNNELYYWRVQIKNGAGNVSNLSGAQAFTTSLASGASGDGNAWTSVEGSWAGSGKVAFLRTEIAKKENLEKAVLSITATSTEASSQYVYNLYVNGEEIGMGPQRQDNATLYYDTYDITGNLNDGNNAIGILAYSESSQGVLCQITYFYSDGSKEVLTNTGANRDWWRGMNGDSVYLGGDNTSIGTGYYTARRDNVNGQAYPDGWNQAGFAASGWSGLSASGSMSGSYLAPGETETMKRHEITPVSVEEVNGTYLVDFGREIIGSIRLDLDCSAANISLEYGEELDDNGNAKYKLATGNIYQETWSLRGGSQSLSGIGMKTFRYVTIRNMPTELNSSNVKGLAIYQEFDENASSFSSSNSTLNDLYNLTKYTSKVNGQVLYVDSQNRERKAYEGDALVTAMNNYSYGHTMASSKYTAEYLINHTTWPAEYSLYNIILVYQNYLETNDVRSLAGVYEGLKGKTLLDYYDSNMGLLRQINNSSQRTIVDWPSSNRDNYDMTNAYYNTVLNAAAVGAYESMAQIAAALGYSGDASYYQGLSDRIRTSLISRMYNSSKGRFCDGLKQSGEALSHCSQQATAWALAFGIYDSQSMADTLASSIESDGELKCSIFGSYFLLQGLYKSNHGSLAKKILCNSESTYGVQSFGYVLYGLAGGTTPEAWNSELKSNLSYNHPWGCAPGVWLMRGLFGINPTSAGYKTFDIKLQPGGISQASMTVPTIKGTISVNYSLSGGNIFVNAEIPGNTRAKIFIPVSANQTSLNVDGKRVSGSYENGFVSYELSGGSHTISSSTSLGADDTSELRKTDVVYKSYTAAGWTGEVTNGISSGVNNSTKIQAINMTLRNADVSGELQYATYMQSYEWQDWVSAGNTSGITDQNKRLEAIKIRLTGQLADRYDVYYRTYVDGDGWLDWAKNGAAAGSSGRAKAVYKIQVKIVNKGADAPGDTARNYLFDDKTLTYQTHVQSYGWQSWVGAGELAGTTGQAKRLEGICIKINDQEVSGGITYQTHVQTYGWQDWVSDGAMAGTSGEAKRLEAIRIALTGDLEYTYDVYYRVHAQSFGWLGWAKNGEPAGTAGYAKRLEAIQIVLVAKGDGAPGDTDTPYVEAQVSYRTHVQSYGWLGYVLDGATSGTSGQAKRLEGIQIQNKNTEYSGSIQYRTHVQTYGWEDGWRSDGEVSGTSGQAKRLEAIQIQLTGELAEHYDVYYRVHIQSYGWLDWAKNGESAGSEGLSKRLEAIEIVYVKKGNNPPGDTTNAFVQ